MRYASVLDAIGHTPLVRLRLGDADVHAKLELQNLYGMKDRVARRIILDALDTGLLRPGAPLVESSSGTMACGVALVGAALGHPVYIVTDPRIDPITLAKLRALGARVQVVEKMTGAGWQSARLEALTALRRTLPGSFWPQQYSNPMNPAAYEALAAELLDDLGHVDVLVGSVGSGGSLCGTARALRRTQPGLRVVGIDAVGSALFAQPDRPTRLQSGLGNSLVPDNLDHGQIDEVHWLTDREAFEATRELAADQALFAGNTSGSVYRVLTHLARTEAPGTRIVGIFPDRGDRYHDTVYSAEYWERHALGEQPVRTSPRTIAYGAEATGWSRALPHTRPQSPAAAPRTERSVHGVPATAVR